MAGLDPRCLPWVHKRGVALLVSDSASDALPSATPVPVPVHVGALVYMGCHMVDNAQLEDLATRCADTGRWSFLFSLGALLVPKATCSPVNPIAIL